MTNIVFNFFTDSKETGIKKAGSYFARSTRDIEEVLMYGCSAESFIDKLQIDVCKFDSNNASIVGRHITTSTPEQLRSFTDHGLLDLRKSLQTDTPLSIFLRENGIRIDVDSRQLYYKGKAIHIEESKGAEHQCFLGKKTVCSWDYGCEAFKKLSQLGLKLYRLGATLEFFIAGTPDRFLNYSTVRYCPEILSTIDQLISAINNPYRDCSFPLCTKWGQTYSECYVFEFENTLTDLETFQPINCWDYYDEIKGCFKYSNVTYDDYYNHHVPQKAFDNIYLINKLISVYAYESSEEYGSLRPCLSVSPSNLKTYKLEDGKLIII